MLINAAALIYQVSFSSVAAITAVRDGGNGLTAGANHVDYAALAAASVAWQDLCDLQGARADPPRRVTATRCHRGRRRDADTVNGFAGPTTRGRVVRRIAADLGTVRLSDSEQIDFASFQTFESKQPAPVGWYWDGSGDVTQGPGDR